MILRQRTKSFVTALFCITAATFVSACNQSGRQIAPGVISTTSNEPPAPGQIKFALKNPNPEKWTESVQAGSRDGTVRTGYTCKVLTCPEPTTVVVSRGLNRSPRPDKAGLDKIAKETIPKLSEAQNLQLQVRTDNKAKLTTLSSSATKFGAYDGILNETKITIGTNARHSALAFILAGRMLVTIRAEAGDRATARKAVDEFSSSFTVEEGAPL
jgi:hypothetical protein